MPTKKITISGRIINAADLKPLKNLRIEAWDKDLLLDDLLGSAVTNAQGRFKITFDQSYFKELFIDRNPDLFFKVYDNDEFIYDTRSSVIWNMDEQEKELQLQINMRQNQGTPMEPTPAGPVNNGQEFTVKGTITYENGRPAASLEVSAFDKDMRSEQLLGTQLTNAKGEYLIGYSSSQFARAEKQSADLVIRVKDKDGNVLAASPLLFKAKEEEIIDIEVPAPVDTRSVFEKLEEDLSPLMESIPFHELNEDDIKFLAKESGYDETQISWISKAFKLSLETGIAAEAFFAFASFGLSFEKRTLLSAGEEAWRNALQNAMRSNLIPASFASQVNKVIDSLKALSVQSFYEPGKDENSLGDLLNTTSLPRQAQEEVLTHFVGYTGDPYEFGNYLLDNNILPEDKVKELELTIQMGTLTLNNVEAVQALKTMQAAGEFTELKELAKFTESDWRDTILTNIQDPKQRALHAKVINRQIEAAFPTAVIAQRIASTTMPGGTAISAFLRKNPEFEIESTRIDSYFMQHPGEEQAGLKENLMLAQRMMIVSGSLGQSETLVRSGFTSARSIAAMNEEVFIERHAKALGGKRAAKAIHRKAAEHSARVDHVLGKYGPMLNSVIPAVVPNPLEDMPEIPNWSSLFGSQDSCKCEHCKSVYGPASYLVDLLQFLKLNSIQNNNEVALDVLTAGDRRPDIGHLKLTCENTNTPMPYIDLVNEVLENAIVPEYPKTVNGQTVWPQTTWSSKDLAVSPEYVNTEAYKTLRNNSVYPWNLPFDLGHTEATAYLDKLGAQRWELMEALYTGSDEAKYLDSNIAAEHMSMGQKEWRLIAGITSVEPFYLWGLQEQNNVIPNSYDPSSPYEGSWLQVLSYCPVFLQRSGLSFEELKEILDLRFLYSGATASSRRITLSRSSCCDLSEVTLSGLSEALLTKITRFVRLQRKLGWSIAGLDATLHVLGITQLGATELMKVSHVYRLQKELKLPLYELISWWGNLDAVSHNDKPSWYESIFLNKSLKDFQQPADDELFRNIGRGISVTGNLTGHLPRIASALGTSAQALMLIITPADPLNLQQLSRLYRWVSFARTFGTGMDDLLRITGFTGDPFASTHQTLLFIDKLERVKSTAFTIKELEALLKPGDGSVTEAMLRQDAIILEQLRKEIGRQDAGEQEKLVAQHISTALGVDTSIAARLLEWITSPARMPAMRVLTNLSTISTELTSESFGTLMSIASANSESFKSLERLRKAAVIIHKLKISAKELNTLHRMRAASGWLNLNDLPLHGAEGAPSPAALFDAWLRLSDLFRFRDSFGVQAPSLFDVFDLTSGRLDAITRKMRWSTDDARALATHFGSTTEQAFTDERTLHRLHKCFKLSARMGVLLTNPSNIIEWTGGEVSSRIAQSIRQALKSKYSFDEWYTVARPIQDSIRLKKKDALLSFLMGAWNEPDSNRIFRHYLIDVEMSPCQMTSRVKQAISAIQMFVQQCVLGLEERAGFNAPAARMWEKWMKSYRIWEANRKIFLYPENWMEPELRDDKTPFFKQLENELRQNDVTAETVESALLNYLEKLDTVSKLEISAIYHEETEEKVHIIGRTKGVPHEYYYRNRNRNCQWSAWEKIEADIEGDHLILTMWNRRLHLFWPMFQEKAERQPLPEANSQGSEPKKYWAVQMAWSELRNGKWTAKKVTKDTLVPRINGASIMSDRYPIAENEELWSDHNVTPEFTKSRFHFTAHHVLADLEIRVHFAWPLGVTIGSTGGFLFSGNSGFAKTYIQGNRLLTIRLNSDFTRQQVHHNPSMTRKNMLLTSWPFFNDQDIENRRRQHYNTNPHLNYGNTYLYTQDLWRSPREYQVLLPGQDYHTPWTRPWVFQDTQRSLLLNPSGGGNSVTSATEWRLIQDYKVELLYHPYVSSFIRQLNAKGIEGLYNPPANNVDMPGLRLQRTQNDFFSGTNADYTEVSPSIVQRPVDKIDFEADGAYAVYNWEMFYHIPMLIADRLSKNQQFAEAMKWYHFIFDPTVNEHPDEPASKRYWKLGKFFDNSDVTKTAEELLRLLSTGNANEKRAMEEQVRQWRENPFLPFMIGRMRITPFQKNVVMKYLDNLIAWGDQLFRRNTMETINEAAQLYILALTILGSKPKELPGEKTEAMTYRELEAGLDSFSNSIIAIENLLTIQAGINSQGSGLRRLNWGQAIGQGAARTGQANILSTYELPVSRERMLQVSLNAITPSETVIEKAETMKTGAVKAPSFFTGTDVMVDHEIVNDLEEVAAITGNFDFATKVSIADIITEVTYNIPQTVDSFYFCIPKNDKMLGYWDTVGDRLFKIRNCMNIHGSVQQLPLFDSPIDPGLLVRAAAAGVDLSSAASGRILYPYRFNVMIQKAMELCNDVKALGSALLSALEKRDAEEISKLRSTHEVNMLQLTKEVRQQQLREAKETLEGLRKGKAVTEHRRDYYRDVERVNAYERQNMNDLAIGHVLSQVGQGYNLAASIMHAIPDFTLGISGFAASPHVVVQWGGSNLGHALTATAGVFNMIASHHSHQANMASIQGGHERRWNDWKLQEQLADRELLQIDKQIAAAEIRVAIADMELRNHTTQLEQARTADEFMRSKFTNRELYDWMAGQLSNVYFQSYQLAYDIAKRAEDHYRFDLGLKDNESNFIGFGYWDSMKSGLLAAEKLGFDLRRMEMAYLKNNNRDQHEFTKHISLAMTDPRSLLMLRTTGECYINVPEALLDIDHPGYYKRKIKSVSLTIPCVTGPHTGVNGRLELVNHTYSIDESRSEYESNSIPQSIALSSSQNDAGLFEVNFRDERYLPFEGAGAISTWRLVLPEQFRQFDYSTISDVVMHMKYTGYYSNENISRTVTDSLNTKLEEMRLSRKNNSFDTGLFRMFSMRQDFGNEWYSYLHQTSADSPAAMPLTIAKDYFPFMHRERNIKFDKGTLYIELNEGADATVLSGTKLSLAGTTSAAFALSGSLPGLLTAEITLNPALQARATAYELEFKRAGNSPEAPDTDWVPPHNAIADMILVIHYTIS